MGPIFYFFQNQINLFYYKLVEARWLDFLIWIDVAIYIVYSRRAPDLKEAMRSTFPYRSQQSHGHKFQEGWLLVSDSL